MSKSYIAILVSALCVALTASGQSAMDAFTVSRNQLRGTARYMSMGGAFGALGGDLSTLNQNPAGLGVYRSSEVGATLDVDFQRFTPDFGGLSNTTTQTRAACNNFGYAGSVSTGSELMPYFAWGATYNRVNSFERRFRAEAIPMESSWTNYVAAQTAGFAPDALWGDSQWDPFGPEASVPWKSVLAYNAGLINAWPVNNEVVINQPQDYTGIWQRGARGHALAEVHQKGYVDEYSINFGGNFSNMVYWGIGFGITDLSYQESTYYYESIQDGLIRSYPQAPDRNQDFGVGNLDRGPANWGIDNYKAMSGTGFNVKFGLIFKPVNEFRIGLAVHTPTWYHLTYSSSASMNYFVGYDDDPYPIDSNNDRANKWWETPFNSYNFNIKSPWRLMASAAGVLGGRFIISADYVYEAYPDMQISDDYGPFDVLTNDIKQYYQATHELRLGAEYRVLPSFSVRAGYNFKSAPAKADVRDGRDYIYTGDFDTQSMAEFNNETHNVSFGLGYRTGGFYIDAAFVHTTGKSEWFAYSPYPAPESGYAVAMTDGRPVGGKVTDTHNRLVLSLGFKF